MRDIRTINVTVQNSALGEKTYFTKETQAEFVEAIEILSNSELANFPSSLGGGSPAEAGQLAAAQVTLKATSGDDILKDHPAYDLNRGNTNFKPQGGLFTVGRELALNECYITPNVAGSGNFAGGVAVVLYIKKR